jgi:acyl CoA:acetate/3-ketoacid CoA transferase
VTYVTERCVLKLTPQGLMITEIAPGVNLQKHIFDQAQTPLLVSPDLKLMAPELFLPGPQAHMHQERDAA